MLHQPQSHDSIIPLDQQLPRLELVRRDGAPHVRARSAKPADYPARTAVPDEFVSWRVPWPEYAPADYTAPVVFASDRTLDPTNPALWADPDDPRARQGSFTSASGPVQTEPGSGRPLNVAGRTGVRGRGALGCWGANRAADAMVTRVGESGGLELLVIRRRDTGRTALPGGFRDRSDLDVFHSAERELLEEAGVALSLRAGTIVFEGYVDDFRNTDNAWIETTVIHLHLDGSDARGIVPHAGDDAAPGSARWAPLTEELLATMNACHAHMVRSGLYFAQAAGVGGVPPARGAGEVTSV